MDCFNATAVGPRPHCSLPSNSSLPVGISNAGPPPSIQPLSVGLVGEKKKLWVISPVPDLSAAPLGARPCWSIIGRMVREMRFQSSFKANGSTGWILVTLCMPSPVGPIFWSQLYCTGRLYIAATGLRAFFANSAESSA
ncbi:hypothetical protein D3C76_1183540 [compost metagenome]